jgi:hypothetical protein
MPANSGIVPFVHWSTVRKEMVAVENDSRRADDRW